MTRGGKNKGQASPTQPRLTDYRVRSDAKQADNEDNMVAVAAEEASGEGELVGESEGAGVTALSSMKKEFVKI